MNSGSIKNSEDLFGFLRQYREGSRQAGKSRYPITKNEMDFLKGEADGDPDKLASLERDFIEIEPMPEEPKEVFRPINRAERRRLKFSKRRNE